MTDRRPLVAAEPDIDTPPAARLRLAVAAYERGDWVEAKDHATAVLCDLARVTDAQARRADVICAGVDAKLALR